MELTLDKKHVNQLYPFYLGINAEGHVTSFGRSASKTFLNLGHEILASEIFEIISPKHHCEIKDLPKIVGKLISLKSKTTQVSFNGEVLWLEANDIFLFAITPLVQNAEIITKFNLTYSDFPVYSPVFDFYILIHAEKFARKLQTKAIEELEEQNNYAQLNLEIANFCSSCSNADEAIQFTINAIERSCKVKGNLTAGIGSPAIPEIIMPIRINGIQRYCVFFSIDEKRNHSEPFKIFLASLTFTLENLIKRIDQYNEVQQVQLIKVHGSKMSTLGEMAAGIAHELNNPLAIIDGMAWMTKSQILEGMSNNEIVVENLDKIIRMTERSSKIIKGLVAFSRDAVNDEMEKIDLNVVIQDSLDLCKNRIQKRNIRLECEVIGTFYSWGKAVQISQVILNLITNASDAIEGTSNPWIKIQIKKNDQMWDISIIDSGQGIPQAVVDKMMFPFFTTKAPGKGTGLGLSISKTILQNHNGRFEYHLNNQNTCFTLSLPINQPDSST
jgi:C4-dicarboxylate-specific signal transduction histidine kinase